MNRESLGLLGYGDFDVNGIVQVLFSGEPVGSAATWLTNLQLVHESITCHLEKYIG